MKRLIKRIRRWWNYNPYDDICAKMDAWLSAHPNTPNLAKLAYYCNCEVDDIIKEIKEYGSWEHVT